MSFENHLTQIVLFLVHLKIRWMIAGGDWQLFKWPGLKAFHVLFQFPVIITNWWSCCPLNRGTEWLEERICKAEGRKSFQQLLLSCCLLYEQMRHGVPSPCPGSFYKYSVISIPSCCTVPTHRCLRIIWNVCRHLESYLLFFVGFGFF